MTFTDMQQLGRNPARIIPAIRRFTDLHPGRTWFVGEPIWAGRTEAETREATRHEALINAAFSGVPVTILCPYDRTGLDGQTLASTPDPPADRGPRQVMAERGLQRHRPGAGDRRAAAASGPPLMRRC